MWCLRGTKKARTRLFLLDYDGTLTDIVDSPGDAAPSASLAELLAALCRKDRETMDKWIPSAIEV